MRRTPFPADSGISKNEPLFITGFFRSGTSLTTHLLSVLGADLGPSSHLLQAKGSRADLNRDGFFENYLFMDTSLLIFEKLGAWGHTPPLRKQVEEFDFDISDRNLFPEFSVCRVHDDRISNLNKLSVLRGYDPLSLDKYLSDQFTGKKTVKNPHFAVLSPWLMRKWPRSKFLICFREPTAAIASAARITQTLNETVYERYYADFLEKNDERFLFFSFDRLLADPVKSLEQLCEKLALDRTKIPQAIKLIDPGQHRYKSVEKSGESAEKTFQELLNRSLN